MQLTNIILTLVRLLWRRNKLFRFTTIASLVLLFRHYVYMLIYRKYNRFPPGPNGIPIAGVLPYGRYVGSMQWHGYILPTYGPVVSYPTVMVHILTLCPTNSELPTHIPLSLSAHTHSNR